MIGKASFILLAFAVPVLMACNSADGKSGEALASNAATTQNAGTSSEPMSDQLAQDIETIEKFLKDNGIKDYQRTESGIFYTKETVKEDGAEVKPGFNVSVHYTGTLLDGTKFDSSRDRGAPFDFVVGQGRVIKGWDEGLPLYKVGERGKLYIPSPLAYGERAVSAEIVANSILVFDVEIMDAYDPAAKAAALKEEQQAAIAAYAAEKGWTLSKTESGLNYVIESQGEGEQAVAGRTVAVHYEGSLLDGTVFDSSFERGNPIEFGLGQGRVIPGWDEGIALLKEGGKGQLLIPSHLGYGGRDVGGGRIPANSILIFRVELVDVK